MMPVPALPIPPNPVSKVRLVRTFQDPVGRPLLGRVTVKGKTTVIFGGTVIVPSASTVELVNGVLDVQLNPGTYYLSAELWTRDDVKSEYSETVTLEGDTA